MESNSININVKYKTETFKISTPPNATIQQIKEKLEANLKCPPINQKLIYKGKILDNSSTLHTYNIDNDHTIIAFCTTPEEKPKVPDITPVLPPMNAGGITYGNPFGIPTTAPSTLGGQNDYANMFNNPFFKNMINQIADNPQLMQNMIDSNPSLKAEYDSNPQMKEALSNPEMIRAMLSPEYMQMAQNLLQNSGQQKGFAMGGTPGSFPMPGDSHQNTSPNSTQPTNSQPINTQPNPINPNPNTGNFMNPLFGLYNNPLPNQGNQPTNPLMNMYNPMMNPMWQNYMNSLNASQQPMPTMPTVPTVPIAPTVAANINYNEVYSAQLKQMKEMGFINDEVNIDALKKTSGNVNAAVEFLLNMLNN